MPAAQDLWTNFATTTLGGGAGGPGSALFATDTTLWVATGTGSLFASPYNSNTFRLYISSGTAVEVVICTARSGDQLTITRGAEGTTARIWTPGASVQGSFTAGNAANLWAASPQVFNVTGQVYGARGDGTTDDTAAIQAAITACQNAGGGIVWFPAATYLISSPLVISTDNVQLVGASWGAQLLAKSTFGANPMVHVQAPGGSGNFRRGIRIQELYINGNNVSGVIGVELDSTYHAHLGHCWVRYCAGGTSVYLTGNSGARGAYTYLDHCTISDGGAGTGILTFYAENNIVAGCLISHFQSTGGVGAKLQDGANQFIGTVFDNCDKNLWVYFAHANQIIGCQFTNALTNQINLNGAQRTVVSGCYFDAFLGTGSQNMIAVDNAHNVIVGCTCNDQTGWTNFIHEFGGSCEGNLYANNYTAGLPIILASGSSSVARSNIGHNPQGSLATPPAPTVSNATTGGTVAAGTYGVEVTLVTESGETPASPASSTVTTTGTSTITITAPAAQGNAIGWYAYVTQAGGATYTRQQTAGSPTGLGSNLTLTAPPTNTGAVAPTGNSTTDVGTPAVPASNVAVINTTGVDVTAYVTGGTVTAIAVGRKTTGLTSGAIRVPANQTITLTYSVAPTWSWVGE